MLRANGDFRAVEIGEAARAHIHRSHAETRLLRVVDAVEVDEVFERLLESQCVVIAGRYGWREPLMVAARSEKAGLAEHDRRKSTDRTLPNGSLPSEPRRPTRGRSG